MTSAEMHQNCHQRWNHFGRTPLSSWLKNDVSPVDKERLKASGNIVMPRCAQLALHLHARGLLSK